MANIDLAGTKLRLVKTEYGLVSALVGGTVEAADQPVDTAVQAAHSGLVGEWGDFDSAGRTGLVPKMETLGFGHHTGFVSGAGRSDCAAHTGHVVAGKRTTDLAAHMNLVGRGVAKSGSVAHTGSVVRRRTADSVVHTARKHWDYMSIGQSLADCCWWYSDLAVGPEDCIDHL